MRGEAASRPGDEDCCSGQGPSKRKGRRTQAGERTHANRSQALCLRECECRDIDKTRGPEKRSHRQDICTGLGCAPWSLPSLSRARPRGLTVAGAESATRVARNYCQNLRRRASEPDSEFDDDQRFWRCCRRANRPWKRPRQCCRARPDRHTTYQSGLARIGAGSTTRRPNPNQQQPCSDEIPNDRNLASPDRSPRKSPCNCDTSFAPTKL